eukprot:365387-Chlamydomonas_euryale.AAC.6
MLHQQRVAKHGKRLFRWQDGSLRSQRPADNPYAVVRAYPSSTQRYMARRGHVARMPDESVLKSAAVVC